MVVLASNLGWRNVPLKERLEQELDGLRVEVDKDTNAAALAEARLGAGREFKHFLYVTAGSGIGGGVILNGALYRGATGRSEEHTSELQSRQDLVRRFLLVQKTL